MKFRNKKITVVVTLMLALSVLFATPIGADEYVGLDVQHGDATMNNQNLTRGPADLARYYPHGSYYSVNRQACTCHTSSSYCESPCNCGKYYYYINGYDNSDGLGVAYQCAGFAKMCYYEYNEMDVPHHPDDDSNLVYVNLTEANLYSKLQEIGTQAYVRGRTSNYNVHSIFIVGFTSSTVTIWQANYGGACLITNQTLSYSDFLLRMKQINWYYTKDGDYVDM